MEIKLTPTLLIEASSKISSFDLEAGRPIQVNPISDDKRGVAIVLPPMDSAIDGNKLFIEFYTLMTLMLISHANKETLLLNDAAKYADFLKYFSGSVSEEHISKRDVGITPSSLSNDDFIQDEVKEE